MACNDDLPTTKIITTILITCIYILVAHKCYYVIIALNIFVRHSFPSVSLFETTQQKVVHIKFLTKQP